MRFMNKSVMSKTAMSRTAIAAAGIMLLTVPSVLAQQRGQSPAPAPAAQQQAFGSWLRGCERAGRTEICSLRQLVAPKENPRQPILAVAIGRLTPDRKMTMVLKLPTQIDRNQGIGFRIDEGAVTAIPVQGCDAGACTAAIALDDDMLKRLRGGKQAIVGFRGAQGQVAALPVSLQGLTRGIASLK